MKLNKNIHQYGLIILGLLMVLLILSALINIRLKTKVIPPSTPLKLIKLPSPILKSNTSIEEALKKRRSIREYKNEPLTLQQVAQLLWAAQGITTENGLRTAPSAGALYPLEIYLVSKNVTGLPTGLYQYSPKKHALKLRLTGDKHTSLAHTSQQQSRVIKNAQANLIITANYEKTTSKYGNRGRRYVHLEAGHVA